ncbi:KAP family P-loop domain protein [Nostoc sp. PCC 7524]|uniref:ATP-binding protein n=1 Tax=Nostoc sp. (strain ATCC 29411 / PCC 7524) TaxID=28072 RepID=UPI00029EDC8C|nr:ATP-binding protein [Nostoc sp. PCC 7524]AFY46144.1 KAP family P-loop domain protein [Nostoc sp. PCC 7524]
MTSINDIIKHDINPFDLVNLKTGNFWSESQSSESVVESIHQEAISEIEGLLDLVEKDHRSRTVLLTGDSGSGKSYLLARLKLKFNSRAFFAYISPWADNDYIWRHILRYTVDSLIQVPNGQQESQLILWLKSLSAFTKQSLKNRIFNHNLWELLLSDRQNFIKELKKIYKQVGIYNPDIFFGILHDLTDPELYHLACEWLRGDDLSEDSMAVLKVKHCIDSEDAAKNILANFGKISTDNQPIVLCFDQVESQATWDSNPQPIFNINTTIHNDNLKNFLIIISIVQSEWRLKSGRILQSDKARVDKQVILKPINLNQAESLWVYRLKSLHQRANPKPDSPLFPLSKELLEKNFPGGKTLPRNTLILGRYEYQKYKRSLLENEEIIAPPPPPPVNIPSSKSEVIDPKKVNIHLVKKPGGKVIIPPPPPPPDNIEQVQAEFQLLWQKEYKKNQEKYSKISLLSSPDLIVMLQQALLALQVQEIKLKLLSGKYASYSLSYQQSSKQERVGIVWTEDANMTTFFHVMNACQRVIQQNLCQPLYLIRIGGVGTPKLAGNQIYQQIFTHTNHHHIRPNLTSVHHLATYQSLVNSALSQELVLTSKRRAITLQELQSLIRQAKILHKCTLLQDLGIVGKQEPVKDNGNGKTRDLRLVKDFLLNLVTTQSFMGVPTLITNAVDQFPTIKETDVQYLIQLLCEERRVKIINPGVKLQDQLICLVA